MRNRPLVRHISFLTDHNHVLARVFSCYPSSAERHQLGSERVNELFAVLVTRNLHLHGLICDRSVLPWQDQPSITIFPGLLPKDLLGSRFNFDPSTHFWYRPSQSRLLPFNPRLIQVTPTPSSFSY